MADNTVIEWTDAMCPDCGSKALREGGYDSDQIEDGISIYCAECGFEIAGRDEATIRSAMRVLVRWNGGRA